MNELINCLRKTNDSKITIGPRLIAALPLIVIGIGHLVDPGSFRLILNGAGIPMPEVNLVIAPVVEVAAGILLLVGLVARAGGLAAASTMLVALYSHAVIDPSTLPETMAMPPLTLPLAVLVSALWVAYTEQADGAWIRGPRNWKLETRGPKGTVFFPSVGSAPSPTARAGCSILHQADPPIKPALRRMLTPGNARRARRRTSLSQSRRPPRSFSSRAIPSRSQPCCP